MHPCNLQLQFFDPLDLLRDHRHQACDVLLEQPHVRLGIQLRIGVIAHQRKLQNLRPKRKSGNTYDFSPTPEASKAMCDMHPGD